MLNKVPNFLNEMLISQYGQEITNKIVNGYTKKRPVTIRVNTIKVNKEKVKKELIKEKIKYKEVSNNKDALIIEEKDENTIKNLEIYDRGEIYLQSLSSMFPVIALDPNEDENILDMTAAPGGKTTQIVSLSFGKSYVTACEKNKIRAERLKYNIEKQGAKGVNVLVQDARKLDDYFSFDKILLDAPCSGSGTLNLYDENLEKNFTRELIERSEKVQFELLKKAIKILKPRHEMIYSTCSILKNENENNILKFINDKSIEIVPINKDLIKELPLLPSNIKGTVCICPNELYEGFFIAKLRKK